MDFIIVLVIIAVVFVCVGMIIVCDESDNLSRLFEEIELAKIDKDIDTANKKTKDYNVKSNNFWPKKLRPKHLPARIEYIEN